MKSANNTKPRSDNMLLGIFIIIVLIVGITVLYNSDHLNALHNKYLKPTIKDTFATQTPINVEFVGNADVYKLKKIGDSQFINIKISGYPINTKFIRIVIRDTKNNNEYSNTAEPTAGNTFVIFPIDIPPQRAYDMFIYLDKDKATTPYSLNIATDEYYFIYHDINGNISNKYTDLVVTLKNTSTNITGSKSILSSAGGAQACGTLDNCTNDLNTIFMKPYNLIDIGVTLPDISILKNMLSADTSSYNMSTRQKYLNTIATLDTFLYKGMEGDIQIINEVILPTSGTQTASPTNLSGDVTKKDMLQRKYVVSPKLILPSTDACIGTINKNTNDTCKIRILNVIHGVQYLLKIRCVYNQFNNNNTNIRYTPYQYFTFVVSKNGHDDYDLLSTVTALTGKSTVDLAKKFKLNAEMKQYILNDQRTQDRDLTLIESGILNESKRAWAATTV